MVVAQLAQMCLLAVVIFLFRLYIPKFIGALAILAGLAYLFTNSANLLLPDYYLYKAKIEMILGLPMALGELAFAVWLIAKGGKVGNYNK